MKKALAFIILATFASVSFASYLGGSVPRKIYGSRVIKFGVDNADAATTCSYFGRVYMFDATTDNGKNMLSILMAAHLSGKKVDVWYSDSESPGTTHENGCSTSNMAVVSEIGFSD